MNAKQLHQMTAPLFAKHPSACPPSMEFIECGYDGDGCFMQDRRDDVSDTWAALIIQGHLVEWLAQNGEAPECTKFTDGWVVYTNIESASGETLLHALIAACMEIEQ